MELDLSMGLLKAIYREDLQLDVIELEAQGSVPWTVNSPGCLAFPYWVKLKFLPGQSLGRWVNNVLVAHHPGRWVARGRGLV
jgi:hypothetical protein